MKLTKSQSELVAGVLRAEAGAIEQLHPLKGRRTDDANWVKKRRWRDLPTASLLRCMAACLDAGKPITRFEEE